MVVSATRRATTVSTASAVTMRPIPVAIHPIPDQPDGEAW